jgi:tetratricopeptide (TPR) repeat protein
MGVVYRARDLALDREVAVKLLLPRFAPGSGVAVRFVDEARITAQLQHPGIPAVYQVGTLADGRPFLAMKLIKGRTLADLLADGGTDGDTRTDPPARAGGGGGAPAGGTKPGARSPRPPDAVDPLAVFQAVCQAVGYAHAHGVIHRDLKPANVMVGAFGEVQVMDWGLAKVLAGREGERPEVPDPGPGAAPTEIRTLRDSDGTYTQAGSVLGTPAYMPPEQAAGEVAKVGPRSDVFGLGGLLCVLLTGRPPLDGDDPEGVRVNAIRGRTEAAFARLDACGADPGVVALCKRCLAFEPADRPGSADAVAAEVAALRRAADDRARQAEARAAEQAGRRRATVRAAGAVAAVLLLGVIGTTAGLARADRARRDAEAARQAEADQRAAAEAARGEAEAKEAEAGAVVTFFEERVFAAARPKGQDGGLGHDVTLREAITAALPALAAGFADRPLVEARLRRTLGATFRYLGEAGAAAGQFERARALYAGRLGPDRPDALAAANGLAVCYQDLGRHADALRLHEETLAACRRALPPDHPETLRSLHNLAFAHYTLGRYADALALHEQALAAAERALPPDHRVTLWSLHGVALCHAALGRYADALALHERTLAARRRALPADHPDTLWSLHNVAFCSAALGRWADALGLYREVLAARRRVLPPGHPDTLMSRWGVATALCRLGRGAEAVPVIDECLAGAAGKAVDPGMVPEVAALRLRHFERAGDPAGCRATAELWEGLNRPDPDSLYTAACFRAVAAAVRTRAPGADAARLAAEDADRAVGWLHEAVAAGFRDRGHIEQDDDLAAVRGRADFRAVVGSLPYLAPPPRPVR